MIVTKIIKEKEKVFEPVTLEVTFETLEELKEMAEELKTSSFKLFDLAKDIIKEYE